jgi:hypothetical protein
MSAVLQHKWDNVAFPKTAEGVTPLDEFDLVAINIRDEATIYGNRDAG